ncbi:MAG: hypothetical protein ABIP13_08660 [Tepidiformaceae bacterium]
MNAASGTARPHSEDRTRLLARLAEIVTSVWVLGFTALLLIVFVAALASGLESNAARVEARPLSQPGAAGPASVPGGTDQLLFIVVVDESRARELGFQLAAEADLRRLLGESPRAAEVIATSDRALAESIAAAINDQANIPSALSMAAILVSSR